MSYAGQPRVSHRYRSVGHCCSFVGGLNNCATTQVAITPFFHAPFRLEFLEILEGTPRHCQAKRKKYY